MLIGNVKEETEEKIDIENDSSYLMILRMVLHIL